MISSGNLNLWQGLSMSQPEVHPGVAETIASSISLDELNEDTVRNHPSMRAKVALVEGSTPHLSAETRALLRDRLKVAALLLAAGFAAFLLFNFWSLFTRGMGPQAPVLYAEVAVTIVLALIAQRLCAHCDVVEKYLRWSEAIIFGCPAAFFLFSNYYYLLTCATDVEFPHVPPIVPPWMVLMYCYALFVPNTWKRALIVLGLMGIAPFLVLWTAYLSSPEFADLLMLEEFDDALFVVPLVMSLNVLIGTVGVHTIGTLRKEAFVARQMGQYRLKDKLGSGGMGEVFLAEHEMMKRPCAVKTIRTEKAGDPFILARFEREVRATAKLSHWNSIDIFDYGRTDDGTFYYVMEYLPGHNLGELVDGYGPLPAARIIYLMQQVCDALSEAHGMELIHRDIKPANIFCAYRGGFFDVAKLLDFGLAKPLSDSKDSELTQAGSITGSPLFMSPEQSMGSDEVDARCDIYSLGAVMYFMATGKPPFSYSQPIKVMVAHASEQPQPPRELNLDLPEELDEIILRCLEKQTEDRFQDVASLKAALQDVPLDEEWTAAQAEHWWHNYGCPKKKAQDAAVLEMAAV